MGNTGSCFTTNIEGTSKSGPVMSSFAMLSIYTLLPLEMIEEIVQGSSNLGDTWLSTFEPCVFRCEQSERMRRIERAEGVGILERERRGRVGEEDRESRESRESREGKERRKSRERRERGQRE